MSNIITGVYIDKRDFPYIRNPDFGEIPVANVILDAGDLLVATSDSAMLVIERKTVSDLLGSISDGRLFTQVAKMRKLSPWCYVVICGALLWNDKGKVIVDHKVTGWDMSAVQGALLTVQELGVSVVFCAHADDFVPCVKRIAKRERGEARIHPVRPSRILNAGETLLASLPGIGIENTSVLLKHCGTPAWTLNYLTTIEDGNKIIRGEDGVKRAVRRALELEDGMELWPITNEQEKG